MATSAIVTASATHASWMRFRSVIGSDSLTCIGNPWLWGSISNLNFFKATLSPVSLIVALKTTPNVPLPTTFSISIPRRERMSANNKTSSEWSHKLDYSQTVYAGLGSFLSKYSPFVFVFFPSLPSALPNSLFKLILYQVYLKYNRHQGGLHFVPLETWKMQQNVKHEIFKAAGDNCRSFALQMVVVESNGSYIRDMLSSYASLLLLYPAINREIIDQNSTKITELSSPKPYSVFCTITVFLKHRNREKPWLWSTWCSHAAWGAKGDPR